MARKICIFEGCTKINFAHGYCQGHSAQLRKGLALRPLRSRRPDPEPGLAWCSTCKTWGPEEDYSWDGVREEWARVCNPCRALKQRLYNEKNREAINLRVKLTKAGITREKYQELLDTYPVCAICNKKCKTNKALAIDHDHACCPEKSSCGKCGRGLLCQDCNVGLGHFRDNEDYLLSAIKYLQSFKK